MAFFDGGPLDGLVPEFLCFAAVAECKPFFNGTGCPLEDVERDVVLASQVNDSMDSGASGGVLTGGGGT